MTFLLRLLFVLLALALAGCDFDGASVAPKSNPSAKTQNLDFASGQLEKHFRKHGAEVGAKDKSEYLAMARAVVSRSGVSTAHRGGDTLYYDRHSNEFAVVSGKGILRTYFKPSQGERYWEKQKALAGAKKSVTPEGDDDDD